MRTLCYRITDILNNVHFMFAKLQLHEVVGPPHLIRCSVIPGAIFALNIG